MRHNTGMDDTGSLRRSVSWWVLLAVGLASVVAMGVLAFLPPTVHERVDGDDHPGYTTVCSSVVVAGWPRELGTGGDRAPSSAGVAIGEVSRRELDCVQLAC